jgi:hypothetical protein
LELKNHLRLGIIGHSEGNGHPYSWAAIFNGYEPGTMASCPYPLIPQYLAAQTYPQDFLTREATVTHLWTQDESASGHIAAASKIGKMVGQPEEMIGEIDALLLARDDAENHYLFAEPFLKKGIPVYIDKPFALETSAARRLWDAQLYEGQIFTCSALRYAGELGMKDVERNGLGNLKRIEAHTPKSWEKYAVHIIEPLVAKYGLDKKVRRYQAIRSNGTTSLWLQLEDESIVNLHALGQVVHPIQLKFIGENGYVVKTFSDS